MNMRSYREVQQRLRSKLADAGYDREALNAIMNIPGGIRFGLPSLEGAGELLKKFGGTVKDVIGKGVGAAGALAGGLGSIGMSGLGLLGSGALGLGKLGLGAVTGLAKGAWNLGTGALGYAGGKIADAWNWMRNSDGSLLRTGWDWTKRAGGFIGRTGWGLTKGAWNLGARGAVGTKRFLFGSDGMEDMPEGATVDENGVWHDKDGNVIEGPKEKRGVVGRSWDWAKEAKDKYLHVPKRLKDWKATLFGGKDSEGNVHQSIYTRAKNRLKYWLGIGDGPDYVDIYRKDDPTLGHCILKESQQRAGVFFADGSGKVEHSRDINKPVVDEKNNTLISQDDINAGLVDKDGKSIYEKHRGLFQKIGSGISRIAGKAVDMIGGMIDWLTPNKNDTYESEQPTFMGRRLGFTPNGQYQDRVVYYLDAIARKLGANISLDISNVKSRLHVGSDSAINGTVDEDGSYADQMRDYEEATAARKAKYNKKDSGNGLSDEALKALTEKLTGLELPKGGSSGGGWFSKVGGGLLAGILAPKLILPMAKLAGSRIGKYIPGLNWLANKTALKAIPGLSKIAGNTAKGAEYLGQAGELANMQAGAVNNTLNAAKAAKDTKDKVDLARRGAEMLKLARTNLGGAALNAGVRAKQFGFIGKGGREAFRAMNTMQKMKNFGLAVKETGQGLRNIYKAADSAKGFMGGFKALGGGLKDLASSSRMIGEVGPLAAALTVAEQAWDAKKGYNAIRDSLDAGNTDSIDAELEKRKFSNQGILGKIGRIGTALGSFGLSEVGRLGQEAILQGMALKQENMNNDSQRQDTLNSEKLWSHKLGKSLGGEGKNTLNDILSAVDKDAIVVDKGQHDTRWNPFRWFTESRGKDVKKQQEENAARIRTDITNTIAKINKCKYLDVPGAKQYLFERIKLLVPDMLKTTGPEASKANAMLGAMRLLSNSRDAEEFMAHIRFAYNLGQDDRYQYNGYLPELFSNMPVTYDQFDAHVKQMEAEKNNGASQKPSDNTPVSKITEAADKAMPSNVKADTSIAPPDKPKETPKSEPKSSDDKEYEWYGKTITYKEVKDWWEKEGRLSNRGDMSLTDALMTVLRKKYPDADYDDLKDASGAIDMKMEADGHPEWLNGQNNVKKKSAAPSKPAVAKASVADKAMPSNVKADTSIAPPDKPKADVSKVESPKKPITDDKSASAATPARKRRSLFESIKKESFDIWKTEKGYLVKVTYYTDDHRVADLMRESAIRDGLSARTGTEWNNIEFAGETVMESKDDENWYTDLVHYANITPAPPDTALSTSKMPDVNLKKVMDIEAVNRIRNSMAKAPFVAKAGAPAVKAAANVATSTVDTGIAPPDKPIAKPHIEKEQSTSVPKDKAISESPNTGDDKTYKYKGYILKLSEITGECQNLFGETPDDEDDIQKAIFNVLRRKYSTVSVVTLDEIAERFLGMTKSDVIFGSLHSSKRDAVREARLLADKAVETSASYKPDGSLRGITRGTRTSVTPNAMPGDDVFHSHVDGSPTSIQDISTAIASGLRSMNTIRPKSSQGYRDDLALSSGYRDNNYVTLKKTDIGPAIMESVRFNSTSKRPDSKPDMTLHSMFDDLIKSTKNVGKGIQGIGSNGESTAEILKAIYAKMDVLIKALNIHNTDTMKTVANSMEFSFDAMRAYTHSKFQPIVNETPAYSELPPAIRVSK